MSWLSIDLTTSRAGYTATLLKGGNITYIGGRSVSNNYSDSSYVSMYEILIFDTNSLITGDSIESLVFHSAVLTRDSKIIIYGGSKTNLSKAVNPDLAMLDINVYPFKWTILNNSTVGKFTGTPGTSGTSYGKTNLNNKTYIFDTLKFEWVNTLDRSTPLTKLQIFAITIGVIGAVALLIIVVIIWRKRKEGIKNEHLSSF
ncbi:16609_t:CDS:2 [Dentiscutata erythropus]|uniref:16609_t:CDS:1 n=1 Tax=Dentiscutata erythropus TaxID=1348616 RepID=A0A9N9JSN9_9GLOM|nr:16609_t:CDS:2 [Dentiscutata erythropus]